MSKIQKLMSPFRWSLRSITFKWTIITSFVISILFTIFALVTYETCSRIMIRQEKDGFLETMDDIALWLSSSNESLSMSKSFTYLRKSAESMKTGEYNESDVVGTNPNELEEVNEFISKLFQQDLNIKIYGPRLDLLFETKNERLPFNEKRQNVINIRKINGVTGLLFLKPVYSDDTGKLIGYVQGFFELNDYFDVRENLIKALIIIEVIGIIVSLIIGFVLSTYYTSPLRKMAKELNSIEDMHKTGNRMPVPKRQDEIYDLALAFNDLIDRMQVYISRQSQFVEDVSHELRTPVAIIEGHLSLLTRWGKNDPEVLEESLEASLQEILRMKNLVQEMLDLSRIEQSEFQHLDEVCWAKEIVHATLNNFKILYPDFNFYLDDDLKKDVEIQIYKNHLEQILIILLDNAVKYSSNKKEILVSLSSVQESVVIMVQDFGEGISKDNLEKIFDRFYRVDRSRARTKGGNGLGLSIAHQLIENYNGTIQVKSHLHEGSSFIFTLPIVKKDNYLF